MKIHFTNLRKMLQSYIIYCVEIIYDVSEVQVPKILIFFDESHAVHSISVTDGNCDNLVGPG